MIYSPGEDSASYGYDKAGGTTYTFNALNQPTESSTGTTYTYDGAGRLTGEVNGSEETTFAWGPFDHLVKVDQGVRCIEYPERFSFRANRPGNCG